MGRSQGLQEPKDLDIFAFAGLTHARLEQTAQRGERPGQVPADPRRSLVQRAGLPFDLRQIVTRIEN